MQREQITSRQLMFLAVIVVFSTGVMFLPSISGKEARQDVWISTLLATLFGVLISLLLGALVRRRTEESPLRGLLQSVVGRISGLLMVWFAIHTAAIVAREFGALMSTSLMPETPLVVFIVIHVWLACTAARNGLEVIARVNEFWLPISVFMTMLVVALIMKNADWHLLLPVLENGWGPVLRGAYAPAAWAGEVVCLLFAVANLKRPEQGARALVSGSVLAGLLLTLGAVINVVVLGPGQVGRQLFPTLTLSRMIDVARFITRVESLTVVLWLTGTLVKLALFIHLGAVGLAQVVGLSRYTSLVFPLGALIVGLAVGMFPNIGTLASFLAGPWPGWALMVETGLPILLLALAWWRRRGQSRRREESR